VSHDADAHSPMSGNIALDRSMHELDLFETEFQGALAMATVLPLDRMSTDEKLRALEEIWADLCLDPESIPAPEWHQKVLKTREQRVEEGTSTFAEWNTAKRRIRDKTS